jgi:hypothetical protein
MKIAFNRTLFYTLIVFRYIVSVLEETEKKTRSSTDPANQPKPFPATPPTPTGILPKSVGTARQLFDELWLRTGGKVGEIEITIREMMGWVDGWTDSKIRHWLRKLESCGFIIVENTGKRGIKRISVNQPTRSVHETPLFDRCDAEIASRETANCDIANRNSANHEVIATPQKQAPNTNRNNHEPQTANHESRTEFCGSGVPKDPCNLRSAAPFPAPHFPQTPQIPAPHFPQTPQIPPPHTRTRTHAHTCARTHADLENNNINKLNNNTNKFSNNHNQSNQNQINQQSANYGNEFSAGAIFGEAAEKIANTPAAQIGNGLPETAEKTKIRQQVLREIAKNCSSAGVPLRERVAVAVGDFGIEWRLFQRWLTPIKNNEIKNPAGYLHQCLKKELAERKITVEEIDLQRKKVFRKAVCV